MPSIKTTAGVLIPDFLGIWRATKLGRAFVDPSVQRPVSDRINQSVPELRDCLQTTEDEGVFFYCSAVSIYAIFVHSFLVVVRRKVIVARWRYRKRDDVGGVRAKRRFW
jgi:hypothetical protein